MRRLAFLAALLLAAACGQKSPAGAPAAQGAGAVNIYSGRHYDSDLAIFDAFTAETGIKVNVIEAAGDALIERLAREHEVLITIEEGSLNGFGGLVMHHLAHAGLLDRGLKFRPMTLPDIYIDHENPRKQYDIAGLNAPHIVGTVLAALGKEALAARA